MDRGIRISGLAWVLAVAAATLSACDEGGPVNLSVVVEGGDPARGKLAIRHYGCGSCHVILGIAGADSLVGPPLLAVARQSYVAGVLPNLPENLVRWIQDPQAVNPRTAMPAVGVSEADARDIAAYLYTLHGNGGLL